MNNINTKSYWEKRFKANDWYNNGGNIQSYEHAKHFACHLPISKKIDGIICDVGCATGDAIPVYHALWPNAKLIGVDFSENAIELAKRKYNDIAKFYALDFEEVPESDIIIVSHVFEHVEKDNDTLCILKKKCSQLFIVVPYKESPLHKEHLRCYTKKSYCEYNPKSVIICNDEGMVKNVIKKFLNLTQRKQIIFEFKGQKQ